MTIDPDKLEAALVDYSIGIDGTHERGIILSAARAHLAQIRGGCEKCQNCDDLTIAYMHGFKGGGDGMQKNVDSYFGIISPSLLPELTKPLTPDQLREILDDGVSTDQEDTDQPPAEKE